MSSDSASSSAVACNDEWISVRQAVAMLSTISGMTEVTAGRAILGRLEAGMVLSRAKKVQIYPGQRPSAELRQRLQHYFRDGDRVTIHRDFWSAEGHSDTGQNFWATGDFAIRIERAEIRILGVEFDKAGILEILGQDAPPAPKDKSDAPLQSDTSQNIADAETLRGKHGGRPPGPGKGQDEQIKHKRDMLQQIIDLIPPEDRRKLSHDALARKLAANAVMTSIGMGHQALRKAVANNYPPFTARGLRVDRGPKD